MPKQTKGGDTSKHKTHFNAPDISLLDNSLVRKALSSKISKKITQQNSIGDHISHLEAEAHKLQFTIDQTHRSKTLNHKNQLFFLKECNQIIGKADELSNTLLEGNERIYLKKIKRIKKIAKDIKKTLHHSDKKKMKA